jgi:hypothetical protein
MTKKKKDARGIRVGTTGRIRVNNSLFDIEFQEVQSTLLEGYSLCSEIVLPLFLFLVYFFWHFAETAGQ